MIRHGRRAIWLACGAGCIIAAVWLTFFASFSPQMNILFITLDTTRADRLGCYGAAGVATPTLDGLAACGVLFERAYAPAPLTLPSHASMFTGLYPPEHGLQTNGRGRLATPLPVLAEMLAARGYETAAFVASFVLNRKFGLDRGFQTYDDDLSGADLNDDALHWQRDGQVVVDRALEWMTRERTSARPFLCWVHLYDPHFPYLTHAEEFGDRFRARPYDAELAHVDRQLKRLTDHLASAGLLENTLIVVAGDHGEGLGEHVERTHGYTLYNATQHVPLIFVMPGKNAFTGRVAAPVSLVDLCPTLLEILHLKAPRRLSGRSLRPALHGQRIEPRSCYAATDDPFLQNGWSPLRSLTTDTWKYIRTTKPELYRLSDDPHETRNLATEQPGQLQAMEQALSEMEQSMERSAAADVQLSPEERRALTSLGYAGGGTTGKLPEAGHNLTDVKDMLRHDAAVADALELRHQGKTQEAIDKLRSVVNSVPKHLDAHLFLGEALADGGETAAAAAEYQAALKNKPDSSKAHAHLAGLYAQQERFEQAIEHYREALQTDPDGVETHYNLGLALSRLGRLAEAESELRIAIDLGRQFAAAHIALGNLQVQQGRTHDAAVSYARAVELDPRSVNARVNLGTVLAGQNQYDRALVQLAEAVRLAPDHFEARFNLGLLYSRQGRFPEAIPHLTAAVRLQPKHAGARDELRRAQRGAGKN